MTATLPPTTATAMPDRGPEMFVLFLQTVFFNGALQQGGTTLQIPDNSALTPQMRKVAAPAAPAPPAVVAVPVAAPAEGSVRVRVPVQVANAIVSPGTVLPPGSAAAAVTRTKVASSNGSKGKEESLVEIFHNGQWQLETVNS